MSVQPDPGKIIERLAITGPLVGFYDAPDPVPFAPLVEPKGHQCVFASFRDWSRGKTLHLTREKHGCGGGHLVGVETMSRNQMVEFLCGKEGLRADHDLMNLWLDSTRSYEPANDHLLIGPLRSDQYDYLRSVTFYVNADQLAVLCMGATYYSRPNDLEPIVSRFGSGCMQLITLFDDLEAPQAIIGSTDHSMRRYLEPWMIAFTVTRPMYERLCRWAEDPGSSLHTEFTDSLIKARGGSLASSQQQQRPEAL